MTNRSLLADQNTITAPGSRKRPSATASTTVTSRGALARTLSLLLILSSLGACSWMPFVGGDKDNDEIPEEIQTSEQKLYRDAQRWLRSSNYQQAISALERLEARFPFGRYAEQAQLELVYARYRSFDLAGARDAADRFIRLHPQHSNVDYAWYLKGLASFAENRGIMDRLIQTDHSKRDMKPLRQSYADFAQLLARFPNSPYVPDTRQRMIYLREVLARSELNVADYYMRRGALVAAANRAQYVLENYPKTSVTDEALVVLVETNYKLGLIDEANNILRVLAMNYPNHEAFDENGNLVLAERVRNRDRSWTNIMTLGIIDRPDVPPPLTIQHPEGFVPPTPTDASGQQSRDKNKKGGWFSWLPFVG